MASAVAAPQTFFLVGMAGGTKGRAWRPPLLPIPGLGYRSALAATIRAGPSSPAGRSGSSPFQPSSQLLQV